MNGKLKYDGDQLKAALGAGSFGVEDDSVLVGDGEDAVVERRKKLSQLSLGGHH